MKKSFNVKPGDFISFNIPSTFKTMRQKLSVRPLFVIGVVPITRFCDGSIKEIMLSMISDQKIIQQQFHVDSLITQWAKVNFI